MRARLIIALSLLALVAAACGDDAAGTSTTAAGQTTTTGSGGGPTCASLMSPDDVAALFGEPAVFDTERSEEDPAAGTVNCVWSSVESEGDLQVQLFQIQVYPSADYSAVETAYAPVEPIAGIGDQAFFSPMLGVSTGFKDGDLVAIVTFSVIGDGSAPEPITKKDQVIDLLRLVHDRLF
jgi:hypothetical protein